MQLLSDENQLESEEQCRRLAKTVDEAMSRFRSNFSIQAEVRQYHLNSSDNSAYWWVGVGVGSK